MRGLVLVIAGVTLAGAYGWVMNIVKLVGMIDGVVTGMMIVRAIGVFLAPLGAVLGFI